MYDLYEDNEPIDPKVEDVLLNAIENRLHVVIDYQEENDPSILDGKRVILPHVYGVGFVSKGKAQPSNNRTYVRAWILRNTSVTLSNHVPMWRLFRVDRIKSAKIMRFKFQPKKDEKYNPDDSMIYNILAKIELD